MSGSHLASVVTVPSRQVPVRVWGDPDAPALVLLHGLFGNSHEWDTVADRLAGSHRVYVPDQRGHGAAPWATDYRAGRLVADLAELVDVLGLESFDLAGHSMGGIVALLYAATYTERVRRLVLLDIGPETLSLDEVRTGFLSMLEEAGNASFDDPEDVVSQWCADDPFARPVETRRWAKHALQQRPDGSWSWRVDTKGIGEFLTRPPAPEVLWSAVVGVIAPTLVLHGEQSWALPSNEADRLVARLRDGASIQIANAAHDLGVQAPEVVADHIGAFLAASEETPAQ